MIYNVSIKLTITVKGNSPKEAIENFHKRVELPLCPREGKYLVTKYVDATPIYDGQGRPH